MSSRREFLSLCARGLSAAIYLPLVLLAGRATGGGVPRGPVLEDRLLVGLRVKTDSDRKFIRRVVQLVQAGTVPVKLVDRTYFWAHAKASRHGKLANNPMVYFRPALVARAAKRGIRI